MHMHLSLSVCIVYKFNGSLLEQFHYDMDGGRCTCWALHDEGVRIAWHDGMRILTCPCKYILDVSFNYASEKLMLTSTYAGGPADSMAENAMINPGTPPSLLHAKAQT